MCVCVRTCVQALIDRGAFDLDREPVQFHYLPAYMESVKAAVGRVLLDNTGYFPGSVDAGGPRHAGARERPVAFWLKHRVDAVNVESVVAAARAMAEGIRARGGTGAGAKAVYVIVCEDLDERRERRLVPNGWLIVASIESSSRRLTDRIRGDLMPRASLGLG